MLLRSVSSGPDFGFGWGWVERTRLPARALVTCVFYKDPSDNVTSAFFHASMNWR
jgi:hypothetical protein